MPTSFRERAIKAFKSESPQSAAENQATQLELDRPTAEAIYEQVARNARQELKRPALGLAVSGVAGGVGMGLTGLGIAIASALLGTSGPAQFVSHMLYPIGFITVILGRAQLFTENTLYPVALVMSEKRHLWTTLRLWGIVLPSNVFGALIFAALAVRTGALKPEYASSLIRLGLDAAKGDFHTIFWSGVMGGWIIAMVAWLVSGSHTITGSVAMIFLLTFIVGLGNFAHCIATSGEILSAVLTHELTARAYFHWLWPAVLGNICGGVLLVTLLEYGQTKAVS